MCAFARWQMASSVWEEDVAAAIVSLKTPPTERSEAQVMHLMDWMHHVPFFAANAKSEPAKRSICEALRYASYAPGVVIMRQGNIGHDFFAILQGSVEVLVNGKNVGQLVSE